MKGYLGALIKVFNLIFLKCKRHGAPLHGYGDFNADYQSYTSELMHEILKHYSSVTNKSLVVSFLCFDFEAVKVHHTTINVFISVLMLSMYMFSRSCVHCVIHTQAYCDYLFILTSIVVRIVHLHLRIWVNVSVGSLETTEESSVRDKPQQRSFSTCRETPRWVIHHSVDDKLPEDFWEPRVPLCFECLLAAAGDLFCFH